MNYVEEQMKRALFVVGMLAFLVVLAGCGSPQARRNQVFQLVEENYETLCSDVEQWNFDRSRAIEGIESVEPDEGGSAFVEYDCGGSGFGSSTAYWGFYYSANDDLTHIWCANEPLLPSGDGFLYQQEDGDNRYYTEKIAEHFYYYEAAY